LFCKIKHTLVGLLCTRPTNLLAGS
jgi:hypothetical protein